MTHAIVRAFLALALVLTVAGSPAATPGSGHGGGGNGRANGNGLAKGHDAAVKAHDTGDGGEQDGDDQDQGDDEGSPQDLCGNQPGDADAFAAARAAAAAECDCGAARNHGQYVRCVARASRGAVRDGSLRPACQDDVIRCAASSTCGKSDAVTCCRTFANGVTNCSIRRSAAACRPPKDGSACVGTMPSCCDACAPGGGCVAPGSSTSTLPPGTTTTIGVTSSTAIGTSTTSSSTTTTTTTGPACGNNAVEPPEQCDPPGSLTCPEPGSPTGAFPCNGDCTCPGAPTTSTVPGSTSSTLASTTSSSVPGTTSSTVPGTTSSTAPGTTSSTAPGTTSSTAATTSSTVIGTTSTSLGTTSTTSGASTTSTTVGGTCAPIVVGQSIPNTYQINGTTGENRCTTNSAANRFGTCSTDADCGNTAGSCLPLPWVTADGQVMPFPTGVQTTFTVPAAAAFPGCEHSACVPCGNPNAACAGVPGCEVAGNPNGCIPRGTQGCCDQPGFVVPTFFVNILGGLCSRVDQIDCGLGVVNTSNPQTGDNDVKKEGDTSDPGPDCMYGTADDPPHLACTAAGEGNDLKGKIVRTLGNGTPDADGIHYRLTTPELSTTWQDGQSPAGTCANGSTYDNGELLISQLVLKAEPTTAGASGAFTDLNADGCKRAGSGFIAPTDPNTDGPITVPGAPAGPARPQPYDGSAGSVAAAVSVVFSGPNSPIRDIGFVAVTPNAPAQVISAVSCTCTPTAGCPE